MSSRDFRSLRPKCPETLSIGLISDTHGLMRPEALAAMTGSDHILHAGDIGSPEVLAALSALAPMTAIRGNNDRASWAKDIPEKISLTLGGSAIHVLHDLARLDLDPVASGIAVVMAGHSHRPACEQRAGVLYVNPGSAGPRRFSLPISVARLTLRQGRAPEFELLMLAV